VQSDETLGWRLSSVDAKSTKHNDESVFSNYRCLQKMKSIQSRSASEQEEVSEEESEASV